MNVIRLLIHGSSDKSGRYISLGMYSLFFFPLLKKLSLHVGDVAGKALEELLILSGLLFLFLGFYSSFKGNGFTRFSPRVRAGYGCLLLWSLLVVLRSVRVDFTTVNQLFSRVDGAGPWIIPIVAIVGAQGVSWRRFINVIVRHTQIAVVLGIFIVVFASESPVFSTFDFYQSSMLYGSGFILLTWYYHPPKRRLISLAGFLLLALVSVLVAKRHLLVSLSYYAVAFVCMLFRHATSYRKKIELILQATAVFVFVGVLGSYLLNNSGYVSRKVGDLSARMTDDTRTAVVTEFLRETTGMDFVVGRGALGVYHTSLFTHTDIYQRENIENGYLQIIHKGGLIMLALFLAAAIPAAYLGTLWSRNSFVQAAGIVVTGRLLDMIAYGLPWTDPEYILFWLCIGICLNKEMRQKTDFSPILFEPLPPTAVRAGV